MKRYQSKPDFEIRKKRNAKKERVDNASLYAGSPMYYYCRLCGNEMVLPESHMSMAPRYCDDCIDEGRAKDATTPITRG